MRCAFVCLGLLLVSCKESPSPAIEPEEQRESARTEPTVVATAEARPTARPAQIAPIPTNEPVPPSPFLVPATPTQQSPSDTIERLPPPLPPPAPLPQIAPPPSPRPWPTSTNTTGRPCPTGRCLANGKCIKPGGPIAHDGAPPDVVFGMCGGNGGPCSPCRCVTTGTALSTPRGEIPIEDLRTNDLVWSVDHGHVAAVRILATQRLRVTNHSVAQIRLTDGFVVEISGEHPTGDGRNLWDLKPGESLQDAHIESLTVLPYAGSYTHDILPDSDTGTYFVHGLWLGSTMLGQTIRGDVTSP